MRGFSASATLQFDLGSAWCDALFGMVRTQVGTSGVTACATGATCAPHTDLSGRAVMANREQRGNKEKKKPKADKKIAPITTKPPAYIEPQLVRKPHKGKDWT
jgi:hypothetical protein